MTPSADEESLVPSADDENLVLSADKNNSDSSADDEMPNSTQRWHHLAEVWSKIREWFSRHRKDILNWAFLTTFILGVATLILALSIRLGHPTVFPPSDPRIGFQAGPDTRGTITIISSCLLTIFSCTYVTVHPNPRDSRPMILLEVFIAFIAPEALFFEAITEYVDMRTYTDKMKERCKFWTDSMSFLALHGVFTQDHTLTNRMSEIQIFEFVCDKQKEDWTIDCKYIESEIRDRRNANGLAKFLTVVQVLRLAIQVIARWKEGLSSTPMEVLTCGYVSLAAGAYMAWWHKPYCLSGPIWLKIDKHQGLKHSESSAIEGHSMSPAFYQHNREPPSIS